LSDWFQSRDGRLKASPRLTVTIGPRGARLRRFDYGPMSGR
jgi:hypothetical protein